MNNPHWKNNKKTVTSVKCNQYSIGDLAIMFVGYAYDA